MKDNWDIVKEVFEIAAKYESDRNREYSFKEYEYGVGKLFCGKVEWDFYLTRLYSQLAYSLKSKNGIVLKPYPLTGRENDKTFIWIEI